MGGLLRDVVTTNEEQNLWHSQESWTIAKQLGGQIARLPPTYIETNRKLWKNHRQIMTSGIALIESDSFQAVKAVSSALKLKVPLYFAASSLAPDTFSQLAEDDSSRAILSTLRPGLFVSLFSLLYCHRRLNHFLKDVPLWRELSERYINHMELGYLFGKTSTPSLEVELCFLFGIRVAALGALLMSSRPVFEKYWTACRGTPDLLKEQKLFRCDHSLIAACIAQGCEYSNDIFGVALLLRDDTCDFDVSESHFAPLRALRERADRFALDQDAAVGLDETTLTRIKNSRASGNSFSWMRKTSSDADDMEF